MAHSEIVRSWTVMLLCGASGAGKSMLAKAIGRHYGVPTTSGDDLVTAVKAMSGPGDHPVLHRWDTDPSTRSWSARQISELHLKAAEELQPAFAAVIADHLDENNPTVLEGDYLLPSLLNGHRGEIVGVLLVEPESATLQANYEAREPDDDHRFRSKVSMLLGRAFTRMANTAGMPVIPARPWDDAVARVEVALASH